MVRKKDISERYRLLQLSAPPDVAAWWDGLEEGEKSATVIGILRASIKRRKA